MSFIVFNKGDAKISITKTKKISALKKEIELKIDQHSGPYAWEALAGIEVSEQEALAIVYMISIYHRGYFLVYLYKNYWWANHFIKETENKIKLDCSGKILLLQIKRGAIK